MDESSNEDESRGPLGPNAVVGDPATELRGVENALEEVEAAVADLRRRVNDLAETLEPWPAPAEAPAPIPPDYGESAE